MKASLIYKRWYVSIAIIVAVLFFAAYGLQNKTLYSDTLGYYSFLPSTFIYHNLKSVTVLPTDKNINPSVIQYFKDGEIEFIRSSKGYYVNQYTYGTALMEAPFFFIAHAYETFIGGTPNGYSFTYELWIKISSIVYTLLGLWLTYKVLIRYYTSAISSVTLVIIAIGSNLFWFTIQQAGMSHIPLFFLYAVVLYSTVKIYAQPRLMWFLIIGLALGLITLIRVPDVLCAAIPLLYNVYNRRTWVERLRWFKQYRLSLLPALIVFIIPLLPQMAYYHALTGHYWFYGYKYESFTWKHPHIIAGLTGGNNGWLAYSPVMIIAVTGMLFIQRLKSWAVVLWLLVPVFIYVIYSWTCFIYINGVGSRPMIHLYPLLAIPAGVTLSYIGNMRFITRSVIYMLLGVLIAYSLLICRQQALGNIFTECSNNNFNIHSFYHTHLTYSDLIMFDEGDAQPHAADFKTMDTLACKRFTDSVDTHSVREAPGAYYYRMLQNDAWLPDHITVPYSPEKFKNAHWLKCEGTFRQKDYGAGFYSCALLTLEIKRGPKTLLYRGIRLHNKIGINDTAQHIPLPGVWHYNVNTWGRVSFYAPLPAGIKENDQISLYVWNNSHLELCVRDITLLLCK